MKLSILVNGEPVDALGMIVHRSQSERRGRALCARLKELIPRQLFKIAIQAAIGGKVIARETVSAHAQGRHRQMLWRRRHAASASCWTSRRRARSGCASTAMSRFRNPPSSPPSRSTATAEESLLSAGGQPARQRNRPKCRWRRCGRGQSTRIRPGAASTSQTGRSRIQRIGGQSGCQI